MVTQCVILLGGLGTRLGILTREIPKPLLPVAGKPFLELLLREAARFGIKKVLLLAGFRSEVVQDYLRQSGIAHELDLDIQLSVEPNPLGTGGALAHAFHHLDDKFILLNGDTWFDFNWLDLAVRTELSGRTFGLALRRIDVADRYEAIEINDEGHVMRIVARGTALGSALINGGAYYISKEVLSDMPAPYSLENDLLPKLSSGEQLFGSEYGGFFIDIGIPETYEGAQTLIPKQLRRPAVFLDRDGILNRDLGYVHRPDQIEWVDNALSAIKHFNDNGYYVFVVTNQAGVARGFYGEEHVRTLHAWMHEEMRKVGAHIDDWRYCPFHEDALLEKYRGAHPWRKPAPGMLLDLMEKWPIDTDRSIMVGDQPSDVKAARSAGLKGYLFEQGDLLEAALAAADQSSHTR